MIGLELDEHGVEGVGLEGGGGTGVCITSTCLSTQPANSAAAAAIRTNPTILRRMCS